MRWLTAVPAHFMVQTLELTNCFMTVRFSGGSVSALLTSDVIKFRPKIIIDIRLVHVVWDFRRWDVLMKEGRPIYAFLNSEAVLLAVDKYFV